jgi:hypothetical protein
MSRENHSNQRSKKIYFFLFILIIVCPSYALLDFFVLNPFSKMSSTKFSGTLKEPQVTETSVASSPSLSAQDEKHLPTPSSDSINLESQIPKPPPYHVFSRSRKMQMVYIVSLAAIFSPLSSNIYFPALGLISKVIT